MGFNFIDIGTANNLPIVKNVQNKLVIRADSWISIPPSYLEYVEIQPPNPISSPTYMKNSRLKQ